MSRVPTITIELLRGGPPHNQLLSPVTEYLALCGDASPHSMRLPFEHRDLTDRLRMLRYLPESADTPAIGPASPRAAELHRLGRDVGAILGSVPSFAAELTGLRPDPKEILHLRFVLVGNELALVPWEAAHIPVGLPGAGLPLLLNPTAPVSLTREVRGAARRQFQWDRDPRVLFITADAGDFPSGTVEAHLLALHRAVETWAYTKWKDNGWRIDYPVEVIERASIEQIRARCGAMNFTHVHILAHGERIAPDSDARFGLRLHDSNDWRKRDIVSGERLAQALRIACGADGPSDPVLVSLATCDSANQGSVVVPGGSIAHELHQYGIPWVIASQLPLTVLGSVVLTEDFYAHLLCGEDPRRSLQCLRSHLAARFDDRHDWASLVIYASVPGNFDRQVRGFRREATKARRDRAYSLLDRAILRHIANHRAKVDPLWLHARERLGAPSAFLERERIALEEADRAFQHDLKESEVAADHAVHGALLKRLAELQWLRDPVTGNWKETLRRALEAYESGSRDDNRADHWAIGQAEVLKTILTDELLQDRGPNSSPSTEWRFAWLATRLRHVDDSERMWAESTAADLIMVAIARGWPLPEIDHQPGPEDVVETLSHMLRHGSEALWTTFRQFWRYQGWWSEVRVVDVQQWVRTANAGYRFLLEQVERMLLPRAVKSPGRDGLSDAS